MSNKYIQDVILFNSLDIESRRVFLFSMLKKYGLSPQNESFYSCFGAGENIFAEIGNSSSQKSIVISAHYDGDSIFDNAGGVIALLYLSKRLSKTNHSKKIVVLFTDQEETYQQGAAYFINNYGHNNIQKNLNIDGFGVGNELFMVSDLFNNKIESKELLVCDSDEFQKVKIPSLSYFSAFMEDFITAKLSGNIISSFKNYNNESFFKEKFKIDNYLYVFNKVYMLI